MDSQISLFDTEKKQAQRSRMDDMFLEWSRSPAEKVIHENDGDRPSVVAMLRSGFGFVWNQARHRCPALPPGKYIWLNEIELPEYWVLNDEGDPCGEHVEVCPFCGADLKHGKGDVIMEKADGYAWKIKGYLEG